MSELIFNAASHTYRLDGRVLPSVTRVLAPLNDFGGVSDDVIEAAATRGTLVHMLTEYLDAGTDIPEDVRQMFGGYLDAYERFKRDCEPLILAREQQVYSGRYGYAGTVDRVLYLNRTRAVVDIKTTAKLSPLVGLQLAAYQQAWSEMAKRSKDHACSRFALQLKPDGTYRLQEYKDADDIRVFLAALRVWEWKAQHKMEEIT